jgi:hypothetical protein
MTLIELCSSHASLYSLYMNKADAVSVGFYSNADASNGYIQFPIHP